MKWYLQKAKDIILAFYSFNIQQIPRKENIQADTLSKFATSVPNNLYIQVFFEVLEVSNINKLILVLKIDAKSCWMDPLI